MRSSHTLGDCWLLLFIKEHKINTYLFLHCYFHSYKNKNRFVPQQTIQKSDFIMGIWCGGWPLPLLTDKCQTEIGARVQENQKNKTFWTGFDIWKRKMDNPWWPRNHCCYCWSSSISLYANNAQSAKNRPPSDERRDEKQNYDVFFLFLSRFCRRRHCHNRDSETELAHDVHNSGSI